MSIIVILLSIGLSMDAFSLSLIYGTLNLDAKTQKLMSLSVGIFHFFMPILGYQIGEMILKLININPNTLVGIIFIILGIEMILSVNKDEQVKMLTSLFSIILFSFTVSIDSFSIGIGFGVAALDILLPCITFSLTSMIFTYMGVMLGNRLSNKFGSITTILGAIILLVLGISYIF